MESCKNIKTGEKTGYLCICVILFTGVVLRFWAMSLGHNFDFESYCIVGDIAGHFQNVYGQTSRYNYGPVFFCVQGMLYNAAQFFSSDPVATFRVLIVAALTSADMGISLVIWKKYSAGKAAVFFLNPVSILITGYHNQFDNAAVFLFLAGLLFYNEEEGFSRRDGLFVLFFSFSLMTKHILFLFPVFLLVKQGLPIKKKLLYGFVPPAVFLMSFLPFVINSRAALEGAARNVFLYRSFNNAPLLSPVYQQAGIPGRYWFYIYILIMAAAAMAVRKETADYQGMVYLVSMVLFSSAVANQYLAIPMAAVCALSAGIWKYAYMAAVTLFLFLNADGLGMTARLPETAGQFWKNVLGGYASGEYGYKAAAYILLIILARELAHKKLRRQQGRQSG